MNKIVLTGSSNILKAGQYNAISNFFSNLIFIKGPTFVNNILFEAIFEYISSNKKLMPIIKEFVDNLILYTFHNNDYNVI